MTTKTMTHRLIAAFLSLALGAGPALAAVESSRMDFNGVPKIGGHSATSGSPTVWLSTEQGQDEPRNIATTDDGLLLVDDTVWDSSNVFTTIADTTTIVVGTSSSPIHLSHILIMECARADANQRFGIYDINGLGKSTSAANLAIEFVSSTAPAAGFGTQVNSCSVPPKEVRIGKRLTSGLTVLNQGTGGTAAKIAVFYRKTGNVK